MREPLKSLTVTREIYSVVYVEGESYVSSSSSSFFFNGG